MPDAVEQHRAQLKSLCGAIAQGLPTWRRPVIALGVPVVAPSWTPMRGRGVLLLWQATQDLVDPPLAWRLVSIYDAAAQGMPLLRLPAKGGSSLVRAVPWPHPVRLPDQPELPAPSRRQHAALKDRLRTMQAALGVAAVNLAADEAVIADLAAGLLAAITGSVLDVDSSPPGAGEAWTPARLRRVCG